MVFSGLKLLETRTHRDATVAAFLGYFLIITNFLYTQTIPTAVADGRGAGRDHRHADRLQRAAARAAAPTCAPRACCSPTRRPRRWCCSCCSRACRARCGACRRTPTPASPVSPTPWRRATCASLAQSDAIAFRAEFQGDSPPPALRYWRGPVLWDFDGRTWQHRLPDAAAPASTRRAAARATTATRWCSSRTTGTGCSRSRPPPRCRERARITADGQLLAAAPVRARMRYEMSSVVDAAAATPDEEPRLLAPRAAPAAGLQPARALALAAQWRARSAGRRRDPRARRRVPARRQLRLHPRAAAARPRLGGRVPVRHARRLLRALLLGVRVPDARRRRAGARGDRLPGRRAEPARRHHHRAPVRRARLGRGVRARPRLGARRSHRRRRCPRRVDSGLARAVPAGERAAVDDAAATWNGCARMRHNWEALAHKWNLWVLGYNPERQRDFMR